MLQSVVAGLAGRRAALDAGKDLSARRDDISAVEIEEAAAEPGKCLLERRERHGILSAACSSPLTARLSSRSSRSLAWLSNAASMRSRCLCASSWFASLVIAITTATDAAMTSRKAQPSVAMVLASIRADESALVIFAADGKRISYPRTATGKAN